MSVVPASVVGREVVLDIGAVAHGGHCVARWDGRVVFVRHTLPGERVRVRVTEGDESSRFLRADAVEVLVAADARVLPPCPHAGSGRCGGCDFQHVAPARQRELLADVVREQLQRLAGLDVHVVVQAVPPDALGWRTRIGWTAGADGRIGLRRHRSHEVEPIERCLIAAAAVATPPHSPGLGVERIDVAVSSDGNRVMLFDGRQVEGKARMMERVRERDFSVSASAFWQGHPRGAETLVRAVLDLGRPMRGELAVDLYAGGGLFSAFLGERVGPDGRVVLVEADAAAVRDARRNLHDQAQVQIVPARVEQALTSGRCGDRADLVVLDPPRTGARAGVVRQIVALGPGRVVYVACDPAALARDVATFAALGYRLTDLRAYALFPMTHHVECVALLAPARAD